MLPVRTATWIEAHLRHYFFQFQSALCVSPVAFYIMLGFQCFEFEFVVGLKVPGGSSFHHVEEVHLVLSHTQKSHVKKQSVYNLLATFCSFAINSHTNWTNPLDYPGGTAPGVCGSAISTLGPWDADRTASPKFRTWCIRILEHTHTNNLWC